MQTVCIRTKSSHVYKQFTFIQRVYVHLNRSHSLKPFKYVQAFNIHTNIWHPFKHFTFIQTVHIRTGRSHSFKPFKFIQTYHIYTKNSHSYELFTFIQIVHIYTICSHSYKVHMHINSSNSFKKVQNYIIHCYFYLVFTFECISQVLWHGGTWPVLCLFAIGFNNTSPTPPTKKKKSGIRKASLTSQNLLQCKNKSRIQMFVNSYQHCNYVSQQQCIHVKHNCHLNMQYGF